jgi:hypothetical protein
VTARLQRPVQSTSGCVLIVGSSTCGSDCALTVVRPGCQIAGRRPPHSLATPRPARDLDAGALAASSSALHASRTTNLQSSYHRCHVCCFRILQGHIHVLFRALPSPSPSPSSIIVHACFAVCDLRQQVKLFVSGLKLKADVNTPLHQAASLELPLPL